MKSKTGVLLGRLMYNIMRSPDTIITVAITPIMMMLLFVYVFGGAIETGTDNYVNYLLPGILLSLSHPASLTLHCGCLRI